MYAIRSYYAPGGTFWPAGLYYDVSAVEREYFDMFFFANLKSYKGAFHMSPDYAWWYGYAEVLGHLGNIRDEAERLRAQDQVETRTNFMLLTGPVITSYSIHYTKLYDLKAQPELQLHRVLPPG